MIRVCSGWHPAGSRQYGRRFLESFDRFWPKNVELQVWVEQPEIMPRDACRDLWSIEGARNCATEYGGDPLYCGRLPLDRWKDKERRAGYSFRFDAAKFWKQILIPGAAAEGMRDGDVLVWLDGDVETIRPIPPDLIDRQLGRADVCYLGRPPKHSEIGFWAIRLNDRTRAFLTLMAQTYRTGAVLGLAEWHSAFVWDEARKLSGLRERNLCPPGASGHVFPRIEIGHYMRHDKGKRKGTG